MNRGRVRSSPRILVLAVISVWVTLFAGLPIRAQNDGAARHPDIERILVPEDDPSNWPAGHWQPIPRSEFLEYLASTRRQSPEPAPARIERAEYSATFSGDTLVSGELRWQVARDGDEAVLLPLDPLDFPFSDLRWSNEPATWGTTRDRNPAVWMDRPRGELKADFEMRGRRSAHTIRFDWQIPPATSSQMTFRLPAGQTITANAGQLTGPHPAESEDWSVWKLILGDQTRVRLSISMVDPAPPGAPIILSESDHRYVIREDGLVFQSDFRLEVLDAPVSIVTFLVPAEVDVHEVTYGGEIPLSWRRVPVRQGTLQRITARLPGPLLGRVRGIRLEGTTALQTNQLWTLPRVSIPKAIDLQGETQLTIRAPLELRSFEIDGQRQSGTVRDADGDTHMTFVRYRANAKLAVRVTSPRSRVDAQVVSILALNDDSVDLTSHVHLEARSGSRFSIRCDLADGWEVVDVRVKADNSRNDVSRWRVVPGPSGRILVAELLESLSPSRSQTLQIEARRRWDRQVAMPAVFPQGVQASDHFLGITTQAKPPIRWTTSGALESIDLDDLPPVITDSPLYAPPVSSVTGRGWTWYNVDSSPRNAVIQRAGDSDEVDATVWMNLQASQTEVSQACRIHVEPKFGSIERLRIVSNSRDDREWTFRLGNEVLANRPFAAWTQGGALTQGEIGWEIELPRPMSEPFVIEGTRTLPWSQTTGLLFVDGATEIRGYVALSARPSLPLSLSTSHLEPLDSWNEFPLGMIPSVARRRAWHYDTTDDRLTIARLDTEHLPVRSAEVTAWSTFNGRGGNHDRHRVRYLIGAEALPEPFAFRLPDSAQLIAVRRNGEVISAQRDGDYFELSLLIDEVNRIDIEYESPTADGLFWQRRRFETPRVEIPTREFQWHFALPRDFRAAKRSSGVVMLGDRPELPWTRRLFGPIGRGAGETVFNPFDLDAWQRLGSARASNSGAPHNAESSFAPPGWRVERAVSLEQPRAVTLVTWNHTERLLAAWLSLLGTLILGLIPRGFRWRWRGAAGASCLAVFLVTAALAPPDWAELAGGAVSGILIAMLMPRRMFLGRRSAQGDVNPESTDSREKTRTFATVGLMVALLMRTTTITAQEASPIEPDTSVVSTRMQVLIPVDDQQRLSQRIPAVYVEKKWADWLARRKPKTDEAPQYLITKAEYHATVDHLQSIDVTARFQVAVLPGTNEVAMELPLTGGHLSGENSCRVNGRPRSVQRLENDRRFLIQFDRATDLIDESENAEEGKVVSVEVALDLQVRAEADGETATMRLGLPSIADSTWHIDFARPALSFEASGARGPVRWSDDRRSASIKWGPRKQFEMSWSRQPNRTLVSAEAEVRLAQQVEVRPSVQIYQCQASYRVTSGRLSHVTWRIPSDMIVQKVNGDEPVTYTVRDSEESGSANESNTSERLVVIEFDEPKTGDVQVNATLLRPQQFDRNRAIVSGLSMIEPDESITVVSRLIGLGAPVEFRLATSDAFVAPPAVTPDAFWQETGGLTERRPRLAWRADSLVDIPIELVLRQPVREVRSHQTGSIDEDAINWEYVADVQTTEAPAFEHVLTIDRAVRIDSVTVSEDRAERLAHWSRDGDRVILYLADKTSGLQQIALRGRQPLPDSGTVSIQKVKFEDASVDDAVIEIQHPANRSVELRSSASLIPALIETEEMDESAARLGPFHWPEGNTLTLIVQDRPQHISLDSIAWIQTDSNGAATLTQRIDLQRQSADDVNLALKWPGPVEQLPTISGAKFGPIELLPDGGALLPIYWHDEIDNQDPLSCRLVFAEPEGELWQLPAMETNSESLSRRVLFLPDSSVWEMDDDADSIESDSLPDSFRDIAAKLPSGVLYSQSSGAWQLKRRRSNANRATKIPLSRTTIQCEGKTRFGRMWMLVLPGQGERLQFRLPKGLQLRSAMLNDVPQPRLVEKGLFVLHLPRSEPVVVVQLDWVQLGSSAWFGESVELSSPELVRLSIEKQHWILAAPADDLIADASALEQKSAVELELIELETIVKLTAEMASSDDPIPHSMRTNVTTRLRRLRDNLQQQTQNGSQGSAEYTNRLAELERKWNELVNDLTESNDELIASAETTPVSNVSWAETNRSVVMGTTPKSPTGNTTSVSWFPRDLRQSGVALLALLPVFVILRWLIRLETGQWLHAHMAGGLGLLGLLWWICLAGGLGGLLLSVIAVFLLTKRRQSRDAEASSQLNAPASQTGI